MADDVTSSTLIAVIRERVGIALPDADLPPDKTSLLRLLAERRGRRAVFELGADQTWLRQHPVALAVTAARTGIEVLQRWVRLERFGHARHRTRIASCFEDGVELHHICLEDTPIDPVNDLFIWGLMVALLQCAGFGGVMVDLPQPDGVMRLYDGTGPVDDLLVEHTSVAVLRWGARARATQPEPGPAVGTLADRLRRLFATDIIKRWKVAEAAKALGVSTRHLQRHLKRDNTSFSEALQRTRVELAHRLVVHRRLSLGEIAFCTGFSDLAHFSRCFRRYADIPPSALRELDRKG